MSYSLIVNREPRLFILSARTKGRVVSLTLSPGANVNFGSLTEEDIDAIRKEAFVKNLEENETLVFTKAEKAKESAPKKTKKRKSKKANEESGDDF